PFKLIPNVGAHGVVDFVDSGVIAHIKFDLVDHSGIGKVDQKHFYLRFWQNALRRRSRSEKCILYTIWRVFVLPPDPNSHGVDFGRVMKIDDGVTDHLIVWDVEINGVVGAQAGRTPVDLHDLSKALT